MTTALHVVARIRFTRRVLGLPGFWTCSCEAKASAMPDWSLPDPWVPLGDLFAKHRKAAGVPAGRADQAISTRIRDEGFRFGRKAQ